MKYEVNYEQIIAGALLKFKRLDPVDIQLLIDRLDETGLVEITACLPIFYLKNYITSMKEEGIVSLNDGIDLDTFLPAECCSLREKMLSVCGKFMKEYFSDFDLDSFYQAKNNLLKVEKDHLLTKGKVLLISDSSSEYEEVVQYGFANVDRFKSLILADQYFTQHAEQLENYHIILMGSQKGMNFQLLEEIDLMYKINSLKYENHMVKASISSLSTFFENYDTLRRWTNKESTYSNLLDRVVENCFINHTFQYVHSTCKHESIDYSVFDTVNSMALPKYKQDLKILYLPCTLQEYDRRIADELGLSISFEEDNDLALGRIMKKLGEYDIIIATDEFSSSLSKLNEESSQQCLLTGRQLTLLLTYQYDAILDMDEDHTIQKQMGEHISCTYGFGGNLAFDSSLFEKHFRLALEEDVLVDESRKRAIIETSISLYNERLRALGKSLQNYDLKTADDYDRAYALLEHKEQQRKNDILKPLQLFEGLRHRIEEYLWYKKEGFITEEIEGLEIREGEEEIQIINLSCGKVICTMTFCRNYKQDNLRICAVQSRSSNKERLMQSEMIGLYTSQFDQLKNIPKRPNERQMRVITSIDQKTRDLIDPLNEEGSRKMRQFAIHDKGFVSV